MIIGELTKDFLVISVEVLIFPVEAQNPIGLVNI